MAGQRGARLTPPSTASKRISTEDDLGETLEPRNTAAARSGPADLLVLCEAAGRCFGAFPSGRCLGKEIMLPFPGQHFEWSWSRRASPLAIPQTAWYDLGTIPGVRPAAREARHIVRHAHGDSGAADR